MASANIDQSNEFKEEPKKKTSVVKYVLYIVLVIFITVAAIVISMWGKFDEVFSLLGGADVGWLFITLGIMFVSVLIKSLIIFCFARLYTHDYKYHQALAVDSIGNFYSAITPGATGGEVMQAYVIQKQGLPVSNAVSMLAMQSIIYQTTLTAFGLISFIVKFDFLNTIGGITINLGFLKFDVSIWFLTIFGFFLNICVIVLIFMMSYWRGFHNFIMGPCVSLGYKLHIVRNKDKARENLRVQVENFKIELRRLLTNIPFTILTIVLFVGFFILRFALPYFVGQTLHNESQVANMWDAVFLSNYHQMVTGIIPLPGSAGVSEYFFSELFMNKTNPAQGFYFKSVYDSLGNFDLEASKQESAALCSAALLIWRTVSFTLPLLIAGFVTAFYHTKGKHSARFDDKEVIASRKTMIEMKRETLVARQDELDDMIHTNSLSKEAIFKKVNVFHKKDEKIKDSRRDNDKVTEIDMGEEDDE